MSDSVLRALERAWSVSGSVTDEIALVSERVRLGHISIGRVAMAAALGREAALAVASTPAPFDDESWVWDAAVLLTMQERAVFAARCARRAVGVWEAAFPADERPRIALAFLEEWVQSRTPFHASLSDDLEDAAAQAEFAAPGDGSVGRAVSGLRTVIDALELASEGRAGVSPSEDIVLYAATKARTARGETEEGRQREDMCRLLLHGPEGLERA